MKFFNVPDLVTCSGGESIHSFYFDKVVIPHCKNTVKSKSSALKMYESSEKCTCTQSKSGQCRTMSPVLSCDVLCQCTVRQKARFHCCGWLFYYVTCWFISWLFSQFISLLFGFCRLWKRCEMLSQLLKLEPSNCPNLKTTRKRKNRFINQSGQLLLFMLSDALNYKTTYLSSSCLWKWFVT